MAAFIAKKERLQKLEEEQTLLNEGKLQGEQEKKEGEDEEDVEGNEELEGEEDTGAPAKKKEEKFIGPYWENFTDLEKIFEEEVEALAEPYLSGELPNEIAYFDENGNRNWDWAGELLVRIPFTTYLPTTKQIEAGQEGEEDDEQNEKWNTVLVGEAFWKKFWDPNRTKFIEERNCTEPDWQSCYLAKGHCEFLYGVLHLIVRSMHEDYLPTMVQWYQELGQLPLINTNSFDLLGQCLLEHSSYPITTALYLSNFFGRCADLHPQLSSTFDTMKDYYTECALTLLTNYDSDHMATMVLFMPTNFGKRIALEVAKHTDNIEFMSNERVVRIMDAIWSNQKLMDPQIAFKVEIPSAWEIMRSNVYQFYRLPVGKYNVKLVSYAFYAIVFSTLTGFRPSIFGDISPLEWFFWFSNMGFVIQETSEVMLQGFAEYFLDPSNFLDVIMAGNFLALMMLRYTVVDCVLDGNEEDPECWAFQDSQMYFNFRFLWAINAIIVWVKFTVFLSMDQNVGPTITMLVRMTQDLLDFLMVYIFFFIGFSFSFNYYIGHGINGFESLEESAISMYRATMESFEFQRMNNPAISAQRGGIAQVQMFFFVILTMIVLLNLLIAMMSTTFGSVHGNAKIEFSAAKSITIYETFNDVAVLPPPLNMASYVTWSLWFLLRTLVVAVSGTTKTGDKEFDESGFQATVTQAAVGSPTVWYCANCQHANLVEIAPEKAGIAKWLAEFTPPLSEEEQKKIEASKIESCQNCFFPKTRTFYASVVLEMISFLLFLFTLCIPLAFILFALSYLSSGGSKFRRKADTYNSSVNELLEAYRDVPVAQGNKDIQQIFIQLNKANDDQIVRSIERVEDLTESVEDLAGRLIRSK